MDQVTESTFIIESRHTASKHVDGTLHQASGATEQDAVAGLVDRLTQMATIHRLNLAAYEAAIAEVDGKQPPKANGKIFLSQEQVELLAQFLRCHASATVTVKSYKADNFNCVEQEGPEFLASWAAGLLCLEPKDSK
jgi:hypothetical protein